MTLDQAFAFAIILGTIGLLTFNHGIRQLQQITINTAGRRVA